MKKLTIFITALLLMLSVDAIAKGSSFGSRSISISRSSSPSFKSSPPVKNSGFTFGSGGSGNTIASKPKLFQTFKANNTAPTKIKVASDIKTIFGKDYRTNQRRTFYTGYTTPRYVDPIILSKPSYGIYDSLMMWSFLDDIGDRNMYYNHMNEPSFQSWRNDANSLCVQGNQEVCSKLKDLDAEVASLKAKGTKQDPAYMTEGVDASIYLSDNINADDIGEIKIGTGTLTSDYTRFATQLKDKTKLKITPIVSNGSIDNLSKLAKGEVDVIFTQEDTLVTDDLVKIFTLKKPEQTILICNNKSGVKTVNDLTDKNTIYIGADQTGSQFTYNKLVENKAGAFGKNKVDETKPVIGAASTVDENDNACLFAVDTWDAPYIKTMATNNKSKIVAFTDDVNGYQKSYIDDNYYKSLTQDKYSSWFEFWSKGTPVLSVNAVLVTTKAWEEKNPVAMYEVFVINKPLLTSEIQ